MTHELPAHRTFLFPYSLTDYSRLDSPLVLDTSETICQAASLVCAGECMCRPTTTYYLQLGKFGVDHALDAIFCYIPCSVQVGLRLSDGL